MADIRKAHIALCGTNYLTITTPLFNKTFNLSDKSITAIDLISVKSFTNQGRAKSASDMVALINYDNIAKNLTFSVEVYARTTSSYDLQYVASLEKREETFKLNIIPSPYKKYFDSLEHIDETI